MPAAVRAASTSSLLSFSTSIRRRGRRLIADEAQERGIMFEIECAAREEDAQFRIPRGLREQFVEQLPPLHVPARHEAERVQLVDAEDGAVARRYLSKYHGRGGGEAQPGPEVGRRDDAIEFVH